MATFEFMGSFLRKVVNCLKATINFLVDTFVIPGTNLLGITFFLVVGWPLIELYQRFSEIGEGMFTAVFGVLCFAADAGVRRMRGTSLLEYEQGPRVLFFPLWMIGLLWVLIGLIQAILKLVS